MKITTKTSDELISESGGSFIIVFGLVFISLAVALGFVIFSSNSNLNYLFLPLVMFLLGLYWIQFIPSILIHIKKSSNKITCQFKRVIGTKTLNYASNDVIQVETRKRWGSKNSAGRNSLSVQNVVVFKNGEEIPLSVTQNVGGSSHGLIKKYASIAKNIAEFLNVPFQEIGPADPANSFGRDFWGPNGTMLP
jgi:hypothetical protein